MEYSEKVIDHVRNPRNMGELKDADGIGKVGNIRCGDVMCIFIRVGTRIKKSQASNSKSQINSNTQNSNGQNEVEEYIEDIKFKTLGCAAAVAASSMMTELALGKSLEEAYNLSRDDINDSLDKLPPQKYHCSILSADGIKKAIEDYWSKKNK
jgi:nitrogen fixation NifU-like protein